MRNTAHEGWVLVGPRGAGKSSVARHLSGLAGLELFSTDDMIREHTGLRNDVFLSQEGWGPFRDLEAGMVRKACGPGPRVVDTGGGVPEREENRPWLRKRLVAYLKVDVESALARLGTDPDPHRPPLRAGLDPRADWLAMMASRQALYQSLADITLDAASLRPQAIARVLAELA